MHTRHYFAALAIALSLPGAAAAQGVFGIQVVADSWKNSGITADFGHNYGPGIRLMTRGQGRARGFFSADLIAWHRGPGSVLMLIGELGVELSPFKVTRYWPYVTGAFACEGPSAAPDCTKVIGIGMQRRLGDEHDRAVYVEYQDFPTQGHIRQALTIGLLF